jgi:hypothetical protein
LGRHNRASECAPAAREKNPEARSKIITDSHYDGREQRYGIQRQHDRPVLTKGVGMATRQLELTDKEASGYQEERCIKAR